MSVPAPAPMPAAGPARTTLPEAEGRWSARTLIGLVVAECRKIWSTSAWWALLVPAALLTFLVTLIVAKASGLAFLPSMTQARTLGSVAAKFTVVFGLVCATAEIRHRTLTTSYLTAPGRPQLLAAKAVVAAVVGAGYGLVCAVFGLLGVLLGSSDALEGDWGSFFEVSGVALPVFALWAVLGVGVGTLIGNQLAAIIGVLLYLLLVEEVLTGIAHLMDFGQIDDYLPGGAASASLSGLAESGPLGNLFHIQVVPWWLALLIFAGYTVAAVLLGATAAQRRDIT